MPICIYCGSQIDPDQNTCQKAIHKSKPINHKYVDSLPEIVPKLADLPTASRAKRIVADLIDIAVGVGLIILFIGGVNLSGSIRKLAILGSVSKSLFLSVALFLIPTFYFILKDSFKGKSIGKFLLRLTTLNIEKKRPSGIEDSILRNFYFSIMAVPLIGWAIFLLLAITIAAQIFLGNKKRLGDGLSKTMVIEDRHLKSL